MKVFSAYCAVLLIWSTTPLGIKWSNTSLTFMSAITLRMVIALLCCGLLLVIFRKPLISRRLDWHAFVAGGLSLFPNMLIIYWSAQYISSGLISILLGFFPIFVGVFSWIFLRENVLNRVKVFALILALAGLWFIHYQQVSFGVQAVKGALGILLVAAIWGGATVWLKSLDVVIDPLRQSTGSLLIAAPCFLICWCLFDGQIPQAIGGYSILGVGYLVVAGSIIGHTLYFYVLRECSMSSAAAITLMSPVMAIGWGYWMLHERLQWSELLGAGLIVVSLGFYLPIFVPVWQKISKKYFGIDLPVDKKAE